MNPDHEQRTAEILHRQRPELSITLASEVCPEIREFERLSTACANAYVRPMMSRYLERLSSDLTGIGYECPFLLMTSGGGLTTLETASRFPIRLVESGPAGGAILAQQVARESGLDRLLSFDMGGTTAKLCLIDDYEPLMSRSFEVDRVYRFKKGSGLPVRIPVIEMVEIGAGGGSIAHIDKLGRIQVGPESAGSEPGPAAYGRGGDRPAVTDADVQLGRVCTDTFAGGAFELDIDASKAAIEKDICAPLDLDPDLGAFGISEIVDENMAAAARTHAAEFGMDLGQRDMIAFGGAAPLHAARLGEKLGVQRIVIPTNAGVGSAVGFLLAPVAYEVVRSRRQNLSSLNPELVNDLMRDMQEEARAVVERGSGAAVLNESRHAYMRYVGQGHEIAVPLPVENYNEEHANLFLLAFEDVYTRLYGRTISGIDVEVLSWTLTVAAPAAISDNEVEAAGQQSIPGSSQQQSFFDPTSETRVEVPVFQRAQLKPGDTIEGPALITEDQTTTVVTSSYNAMVNERSYIILSRRDA